MKQKHVFYGGSLYARVPRKKLMREYAKITKETGSIENVIPHVFDRKSLQQSKDDGKYQMRLDILNHDKRWLPSIGPYSHITGLACYCLSQAHDLMCKDIVFNESVNSSITNKIVHYGPDHKDVSIEMQFAGTVIRRVRYDLEEGVRLMVESVILAYVSGSYVTLRMVRFTAETLYENSTNDGYRKLFSDMVRLVTLTQCGLKDRLDDLILRESIDEMMNEIEKEEEAESRIKSDQSKNEIDDFINGAVPDSAAIDDIFARKLGDITMELRERDPYYPEILTKPFTPDIYIDAHKVVFIAFVMNTGNIRFGLPVPSNIQIYSSDLNDWIVSLWNNPALATRIMVKYVLKNEMSIESLNWFAFHLGSMISAAKTQTVQREDVDFSRVYDWYMLLFAYMMRLIGHLLIAKNDPNDNDNGQQTEESTSKEINNVSDGNSSEQVSSSDESEKETLN